MNSTERTYVQAGETVRIEMPYSEVCCHLGIAGRIMSVRLESAVFMNGQPAPGHVAQVLSDSGRPFSFPVLAGEAGFYRDERGAFYAYLPARQLSLVSAA